MDFEQEVWPYLEKYGLPALLALVTLVIGLMVIKRIVRMVKSLMEKRNVDASLRPFFASLTSVGLKTLLIISVIDMVGIATTSFIAVLGAAGLAVGMALSGTLQNFAGGVVVLVLKPYKVGDFIEAQGYSGTVHAIQIFHTILKTPDNQTVIIPNGPMSSSSILNYSTEPTRRLNLTFGIGYGDSTDKGKEVLVGIIEKNEKFLNDPEPIIGVEALADSSVNLTFKAWVKSEDYWEVYRWMQETVYKEFNSQGLNIPFPQMDVHVHNN